MGVVISAGVYRKLVGKIFAFGGEVSMEGLRGRIPRPFVVVHSGKTQMGREGCSRTRVCISTRVVPFGGCSCGVENARRIASSRVMRCTRRVEGYDAVNMGSNIAAK